MSYKTDLIKFVSSIKGTTYDARKELDKVVRVLNHPETLIPENKSGQIQISEFVYRLFTRFPALKTEENKKSVLELSSNIGIGNKKTKSFRIK
jgi:hypothetical protein